MEFEFRSDGRLRYANNSNYKNDVMIRKQGITTAIFSCSRRSHSRYLLPVKVNKPVLAELRRIVEDSEIMK